MRMTAIATEAMSILVLDRNIGGLVLRTLKNNPHSAAIRNAIGILPMAGPTVIR
ncbi:MAG: hypothetical protein WBQ46_01615 [Terriglobales bacterium]